MLIQVVYPAILTRDGTDFLVYLPDIDESIKGRTLYEAIQLARCTLACRKRLPNPSSLKEAIRKAVAAGNFISPEVKRVTGNPISMEYLYIDVDTASGYRW